MADATERQQQIQTGILTSINADLRTQNDITEEVRKNTAAANTLQQIVARKADSGAMAMIKLLIKQNMLLEGQDSSRKAEADQEKKKLSGTSGKFKLPSAVSKGIAPLLGVFDAIFTLFLMMGVLKIARFLVNTKEFADGLLNLQERITKGKESVKSALEKFKKDDIKGGLLDIWDMLSNYRAVEKRKLEERKKLEEDIQKENLKRLTDSILGIDRTTKQSIDRTPSWWTNSTRAPERKRKGDDTIDFLITSDKQKQRLKDAEITYVDYLKELVTSNLGLLFGILVGPKLIGMIFKAIGNTLGKIPVVGSIFGKGSGGGGGLFGGIGSLAKTLLVGALAVGAAAGSLVLVAMAAGKMKENGITEKDMKLLGITLTGLSMIVTVLAYAFERIKVTAVLKGILAIGGIVLLMEALVPTLTKFKDVDFGAVMKGVGVLGLLAAGIIGLGTVLMNPKVGLAALLGLLAIGAVIGVVYAAAHAFGKLAVSMKKLSVLNWKNLMGIGAAVGAISAAIAALGMGNLVGSALNGLNRLFGGSSPMEKLAEFAKSAPALEKIAKVGNKFHTSAFLIAAGLKEINKELIKMRNTPKWVFEKLINLADIKMRPFEADIERERTKQMQLANKNSKLLKLSREPSSYGERHAFNTVNTANNVNNVTNINNNDYSHKPGGEPAYPNASA